MNEEDEAFEELSRKQGYWGLQGSRKHQIMRYAENVESKENIIQDEIIKLARQAGLFTHKEVQPEILAFAKLIAEKALAQPHETTLKEFNQFIHDDPNYHIWAKKREAKVEGSLHVVCQCDKCKAHPPQRTWVGLTGEDVVKAYDDYQSGRVSAGFMGAVRAIEAKLKEKNT